MLCNYIAILCDYTVLAHRIGLQSSLHVGNQVISVEHRELVQVLVLMKFNTWPGVTAKYSGTLAVPNAAALLAVTTAVRANRCP